MVYILEVVGWFLYVTKLDASQAIDWTTIPFLMMKGSVNVENFYGRTEASALSSSRVDKFLSDHTH